MVFPLSLREWLTDRLSANAVTVGGSSSTSRPRGAASRTHGNSTASTRGAARNRARATAATAAGEPPRAREARRGKRRVRRTETPACDAARGETVVAIATAAVASTVGPTVGAVGAAAVVETMDGCGEVNMVEAESGERRDTDDADTAEDSGPGETTSDAAAGEGAGGGALLESGGAGEDRPRAGRGCGGGGGGKGGGSGGGGGNDGAESGWNGTPEEIDGGCGRWGEDGKAAGGGGAGIGVGNSRALSGSRGGGGVVGGGGGGGGVAGGCGSGDGGPMIERAPRPACAVVVPRVATTAPPCRIGMGVARAAARGTEVRRPPGKAGSGTGTSGERHVASCRRGEGKGAGNTTVSSAPPSPLPAAPLHGDESARRKGDGAGSGTGRRGDGERHVGDPEAASKTFPTPPLPPTRRAVAAAGGGSAKADRGSCGASRRDGEVVGERGDKVPPMRTVGGLSPGEKLPPEGLPCIGWVPPAGTWGIVAVTSNLYGLGKGELTAAATGVGDWNGAVRAEATAVVMVEEPAVVVATEAGASVGEAAGGEACSGAGAGGMG